MKAADRAILSLALPAVVSNITVPLLGLADTAVTGHLGEARHLAAIAVGTTAFNMIYWLFSFLRMGSCGLAAQALGRGRPDEARGVLVRALAWAAGLGLGLIALQEPLLRAALALTDAPPAAAAGAALYFRILVWGAPAMLALYALTGWMTGMQDTRSPMWTSLVQNLVNIALSLVLVYGFRMGLQGVAWGTLGAQYAALGLAFALGRRRHAGCLFAGAPAGPARRSLRPGALFDGRFLALSRDLFLRTLCLVAVTVGFTAAGARLGEETLAANAVLMQFFMLLSYVMDGLAHAGEALCGRARGAGDRRALGAMIRRLFVWGGALAALFSALYIACGPAMVALLTDVPEVRRRCAPLLIYVALLPPAGVAAFLLDGIFVGLTAARPMLAAMGVATAAFFLALRLLPPGAEALWTAFLAYLLLRGAGQLALLPRLVRRCGPVL